MTSLYNVLQKAIPPCISHQDQALFYNVDQHTFMCQQCINHSQQTFQSNSINQNSHNNQDSIFTLKQIVSNPILLMIRQNSFLSQINPQTNKYHVEEFIRILTDIDIFVKTKKSSHQYTKQFFTFLKESINTKIDSIISKSQQNLSIIYQIDENAQYLKRINTDYYNQFLQTLESSYVNGTTQELNELLKNYSVQNQNPFRRIEQKVLQITKDISKLTEINWQNCLQLQTKLSDPYIWSEQKLFLIPNQPKILSKKQQNLFLPNTYPHLLGFEKQQENNFMEKSLNESIENERRTQLKLYVKCSDNSIQILSKNYEISDDFNAIDTFECKDSSIDMLYELPQKILMTVSYSSINFYSHQLNKIKLLSSISSIKGCSQVLIFHNFCILLAENSIHQIRYSSLQKAEQIKLKIPDTQIVTELQYLFQDNRKKQDSLLVKTQNQSNEQVRNLKLKLS